MCANAVNSIFLPQARIFSMALAERDIAALRTMRDANYIS